MRIESGGALLVTSNDIKSSISGTYYLSGANGTAGSPTYVTYSFVDDANTGMYRVGADTLGFSTGGSEKARPDSPTIIGDKPMALTEATLQDKIEIVGDYKHVQVRTATVISRDGVEISRSFSRHVVGPLDDISGESAEVQAICAVVHTDEVKAAYAAMLEAQEV
jgi:hypothetical protein